MAPKWIAGGDCQAAEEKRRHHVGNARVIDLRTLDSDSKLYLEDSDSSHDSWIKES